MSTGSTGKNLIYDEAMRVPLLVRSPRPEFAGVTSQVPVTAVDIAPTIAELAGATPRRRVDGKSFAPLLRGQAQEWRDTQLIQTGTVSRLEARPGWAVRGVRTSRWTYGVNQLNGTVELYDRQEDPFELVNLRLPDGVPARAHGAPAARDGAAIVRGRQLQPDLRAGPGAGPGAAPGAAPVGRGRLTFSTRQRNAVAA